MSWQEYSCLANKTSHGLFDRSSCRIVKARILTLDGRFKSIMKQAIARVALNSSGVGSRYRRAPMIV